MNIIDNNENAVPILSRVRVSELFSNSDQPQLGRNESNIVKPMSSIDHVDCGNGYSQSHEIFNCSQLDFKPSKF